MYVRMYVGMSDGRSFEQTLKSQRFNPDCLSDKKQVASYILMN